MINSIEMINKVHTTIDIYIIMYYSEVNIPAKPLPQGMRNLAGLLLGAD